MTESSRAGRPRRSSADILADAASELFLENGYAKTTVDQIAQRAGVSRATFFNYFGGKADLLWVDLDRSLEALPGCLRAVPRGVPARQVAEALTAVARAHDDSRVPWALTQGETMRLGDDLVASGAARFVAHQAVIATFVAERLGLRPDDPQPRLVAATLLAAAGAATVAWARAGIGRGELASHVAPAVDAVALGLG